MPASSGQQPESSMPREHTIRGLKSPGADNPKPEMVRFGPVYGQDTDANKKAKDLAWKHILKKSNGEDTDNISDYMGSIAGIKEKALNSYDRTTVVEKPDFKKGDEFLDMMVKDGCFFLQLSLHILGAAEVLGYPKQHPYFGVNGNSSSLIPAMFFVGNQIPHVVIRALMSRPFFADVVRGGKWQRRNYEKDLTKLVLYRVVVEPEILRPNVNLSPSRSLSLCHFSKSRHESRDSAGSNILAVLYSSLLGQAKNDPSYSVRKEFHDVDVEEGHNDAGDKFPSAEEICKSSVTLKKARSGVASIRFHNRVFWACLVLPPLKINSHTKDLLTHVAKYEQNLSASDREVTAYLRFMRDLARTYKDFKILEGKGIIEFEDEKLKPDMVHMLHDIVTKHESSFTLNFRQIRHKINGYKGPPWRFIGIFITVFTLLQGVISVLSYFHPYK